MADQQASSGATAIEVPKRPPGALVGVEVSYKEPLELSEDEQNALKELCRKAQLRDMPARREEVIRIWEHRLFDRGFQHLLPLRNGGWRLPALGTGYGPGETNSRSIFETNIYNSYLQILESVLTREVPTVRFKPRSADNDADITAASSAEKLKVAIERNNKMKSLMSQMARFLCTDGRSLQFTRYMKDGQQFGYEEPQLGSEEESTVPEDEEAVEQQEQATGEGMPESQEETESTEGSPASSTETQGEPRGREVISVYGALESKLPIKADCLAECSYAQICVEIDLQVARAKFPDVAGKLKAWQGGPGGDDIDRLARINTRLGVLDNYITTDSAAYDVTEQITWFRPAALLEIDKEEFRNSLIDKAGRDGIRAIFCGEQFCEARALSMDDQLSLVHALPGDGMHRPGLGDWLIPIQKVLNNWMELADDYFTHGIPQKWMDNEMFDVEAIRDQPNIVGSIHPFDREPNVTMDQVIWEETAVQFPQLLWEFIQFFQGDLSQLLCGAFPALFGGGDSAPTDTMGGMMIQRDQALGRVGLPWRQIKEAIAVTFRQAVQCLAHNQTGVVEITEGTEAVRVEMEDLKGEFLCFPETDEHFPETWTQRQNRLAMVVTDAATTPFFQTLLDSPDNLEILKDGIGMEDMVLPMLEARDKQLGENTLLLKSGPTPNPKIGQLKMMLQKLQQPAIQAAEAGGQPDPQSVQQAQQIQQMIQTLPPQVSSIEVRYFDDDATELQTCVKVLNSEEGRRLANGDDDERAAYENLELHAKEHEAQLKQKKAGQAPQGKPPSVSIALKDLPAPEAAAAATMAGIPAKQADFQQAEAAEAVAKHPGSITVQ